MNDSDLNDVTRAFMNDDLRSKSALSDFKSVRTPATHMSNRSGISYQTKPGRNTSMGDYLHGPLAE